MSLQLALATEVGLATLSDSELFRLRTSIDEQICMAQLDGDTAKLAELEARKREIVAQRQRIADEARRSQIDQAVAAIQMNPALVADLVHRCEWAKLSELVRPIDGTLAGDAWWIHSNATFAGRPFFNEMVDKVTAAALDLNSKLTGGK